MAKERIEYTIRTDGTIEERVEGIPGPKCLKTTQPFEDALGEVVERVHTAEYIRLPQLNPNRAGQVESSQQRQVDA